MLTFSSLSSDVRHSVRQLWRAPGFSMLAAVMLALGIGASVAMFTVVDHVLLRPMPYRDAEQLVHIREAGKKGPAQYGAPFLDIDTFQRAELRM